MRRVMEQIVGPDAGWQGAGARSACLAVAVAGLLLAGCSGAPTVVQQQMMPLVSPASVAMPQEIVVPMPVPVRPPRISTPQVERRDASVKVGKPYQVAGLWYYPAPGDGYDEQGIASWYGPDFQGKSTANGEIYNMHRLTAAHPTLPMPCYVAVTNQLNGRTVVVRINDRGPYKAGRIIDLSHRAAQAIGVTRAGTADVRVRFLRMAPLLGDDSYEEQYLSRQPWYQSSRVASASADPEPGWSAATKASLRTLRPSRDLPEIGWLANMSPAQ